MICSRCLESNIDERRVCLRCGADLILSSPDLDRTEVARVSGDTAGSVKIGDAAEKSGAGTELTGNGNETQRSPRIVHDTRQEKGSSASKPESSSGEKDRSSQKAKLSKSDISVGDACAADQVCRSTKSFPENKSIVRLVIKRAWSILTASFAVLLLILSSIPLIFYLLLGGIGYWFYQDAQKSKVLAPFESSIPSLVKSDINLDSAPEIRGRVLPVDLESYDIDDYFFKIEEEYRPSEPREVSFVIGYSCFKSRVGSYSDGAAAYQNSCAIRIIDVKHRATYSVGTLLGSEPPASKEGGGSKSGSDPMQKYLRDLGIAR